MRGRSAWPGRYGLPQAFLNDDGHGSCVAHSTFGRQQHLSNTAISFRQFDGIYQAPDLNFQRSSIDKIPIHLHKNKQKMNEDNYRSVKMVE